MRKESRMKIGKAVALGLSAALLLTGLSSCGKTQDNIPEQPKGGYVQRYEQLPEELAGWTVKQIFSVGEEIHLLMAKETDGKIALREWQRKAEADADVTQEWLKALTLDCEIWADMKLVQDKTGTQYLYAQYVEEEAYRGHLWRSDGTQPKEITPQKWSVKNEEWGIYELISDIAALDNGSLAVISSLSLDILYGEDGSVLSSETLTELYGDELLTDGRNIYLLGMDNSGTVTEIQKRTEGKQTETIPFAQSSRMGVWLDVAEDGTLISAGSDGIFRCKAGDTNWERLLTGSETDFSLSSCWCIGAALMSDGAVYAVFQEESGGFRLVKYEYDPDAVREIAETLRLYSVYESSLLQNAAAMYHREHPEVLIELQYAYSLDDKYSSKTPDYNSVYQELNTMLMGENAPDILVMDYLNIDSFAEKGLLADINGILEPLEEQGKLLKNITGAFRQEDGNRYAVPLQFTVPLVMGRDITAENMQSLESLAEFLSKTEDNYMGEQTVSELIDKFYPYFCDEIVKDKTLDKEALAGKLECMRLVAENCGVTTQHDKNFNDGRCYNMWDLASRAKLAFGEANGFRGSMFAMAVCSYIKGEFTAFENSFQPLEQMGICTKTNYMSTACDFLSFALSEAVQDTDYYSGFPVNSESLEKQLSEDRSNLSACTSIETADGGEEMFYIEDYSKEIAEKLHTLCRTVDKPVQTDDKIREVLIETLGEYFGGSQSMEETIQKIEGGLKMYLAE